MLDEFRNKTAFVTGAGRNIGRGTALAFAERGANVGIIVQSNRTQAEEVACEIEALGVRAAVAVGNIGDPVNCERMVAEVVEQLGPVDFLVNNAAYRRRQAFADISPDDWNAILSSNLSSIFYLSRLVLPGMAERGFGRIISLGGPDTAGWPNRAHNLACKTGLIGLMKAIAIEFGDKGVTANIVSPGLINTTRDERDYPDWKAQNTQEYFDGLKSRNILHIPRAGEINDVVEAIMFFASTKSSYLTMQNLYVSGGLFGLPI